MVVQLQIILQMLFIGSHLRNFELKILEYNLEAEGLFPPVRINSNLFPRAGYLF